MRITYVAGAQAVGDLNTRVSGVVFKRVGVRTGRAERSRVRISATPLFYWVVTLGKLFTHMVSSVFSAPRNWDTNGSNLASIQTGPI